MKFLIEVDPSKPLHKNYSFWLAICTPMAFALMLSVPITINAGGLCWSFECQRRFIEQFQLPIGILSLSVLFGVMVGRFHGSAQRVASYRQSQEHNTFRNFYDHRKFFSEWFTHLHAKKIESLEYIKLESPTRLYGRLLSENCPTFVAIQPLTITVRAAYRDITAHIHEKVNYFSTSQYILESEPTHELSPESVAQRIKQVINEIDLGLQAYGISLNKLEDWPHPKYRFDFEQILREIAEVFRLAAEFSKSGPPPQLNAQPDTAKLLRSDSVQGYVTLALNFGIDRGSKKS